MSIFSKAKMWTYKYPEALHTLLRKTATLPHIRVSATLNKIIPIPIGFHLIEETIPLHFYPLKIPIPPSPSPIIIIIIGDGKSPVAPCLYRVGCAKR